MPLVDALPDSDRVRLLQWIASRKATDASAYKFVAPADDEFSREGESLAWDSDGWEEFH